MFSNMGNKKKQTYLINGILDSGKSEFIRFTMDQPYFKSKDKTLLLVCEEGEVEYDRAFLKRNKAVKVVIDEESLFNIEELEKIDSEHRPARILIEYNGMWNQKDIELPDNWKLEQQISLVDTTTFEMYYNNMKSIICDVVRNSDLILFNRAAETDKLPDFKRNVKKINQKAEIVFENNDSEVKVTLDEELPYDINADKIMITDDTYSFWFVNVLDNLEKYIGKEVEYVGQVLKRDHFPKDYFVPIRTVMTCCADDLAKLGFICQFEGASELKEGDWVKVNAVVNKEFWVDYGGEGPVLKAISVEITKEPENTILQ